MLQQVSTPKDKRTKEIAPGHGQNFHSQPASFDGGTATAVGGGGAALSHPLTAAGAVKTNQKIIRVDGKPKCILITGNCTYKCTSLCPASWLDCGNGWGSCFTRPLRIRDLRSPLVRHGLSSSIISDPIITCNNSFLLLLLLRFFRFSVEEQINLHPSNKNKLVIIQF